MPARTRAQIKDAMATPTPAAETRWMDVSHYQGAVNWAAIIAGYRLDMGVAKCTEGLTFTDDQFARNRTLIRAAGKVFGAYCYAGISASWTLAQAAAAGAAQGNRFAGIAGLKAGEQAILDLEDSNGLSQASMNAFARGWAMAVRSKISGAVLHLYAPRTYIANNTGRDLSEVFDYLWTAHYASDGPASIWPTVVDPGLEGNTTGWPYAHSWQWSPNVGGKDATVSMLTVAELRNPAAHVEELILSASQFDQLMAAVKANGLGMPIPSKRLDPTTGKPTGELIAGAAYLSSIDVNLLTILKSLTLDAIAEAVQAVLPPGSGGAAPTAEEIAKAVTDRFASLFEPAPAS